MTATLALLMPCLNEARTLGVCIQRAFQLVETLGLSGEVIVADNGSTDGSQAIAEAAGARVVPVATRGYGAASMAGIAAARARYVIMADADGTYDFMDGAAMLARLQAGADMVVGNRFKGGIAKGAMPLLHQYLGNPVLSWLGRLFFGLKIGDFHCGLRGFDREKILALNLRTTGMEFASEMIVRAALSQLIIDEVPVKLLPPHPARQSHLRTWRDGWRHLRFLLLYSPRWLYLYPGLALVVLGGLLSALILPGPFMIAEGVGLDLHSMLVATLSIMVGVQALSFGMIARASAVASGILPPHPSLNRMLDLLSTERLLLVAAAMLCVGFGGVLWCAHEWRMANFGALNYSHIMRILLLAATAIVTGIQLGFTAFMLGLVQIKHQG